MGKRRVTVTLDNELVSYLDSAPNRSSLVAEAIRQYRTNDLERRLEHAYREDREQTSALASEWEPADADADADADAEVEVEVEGEGDG